ncbi:MAG: hypothetical protein WCC64_19395 [Aliidongia sp.]
MTEFDFDVITGPSGPIQRGPSPCGWTRAEEPTPLVSPTVPVPDQASGSGVEIISPAPPRSR